MTILQFKEGKDKKESKHTFSISKNSISFMILSSFLFVIDVTTLMIYQIQTDNIALRFNNISIFLRHRI